MIHDARVKAALDAEAYQHEAHESGLAQGREEGRKEGRQEALLSVARNMLQNGKPLAEIEQMTGLSPEALQSLLH
ncbi:MAG: hypothetical protein LBG78_01300, partial [Azoarcus sp.]|jgi:predicted transposase/invertase (TIGR01784 family)|nr:hypothetical protein [Azoarcus sp.]